MNCLIDSIINKFSRQGKSPEVIGRYLGMKYHINIDLTSIRERIKITRMNLKPTREESIVN